MGTLPTRRFDKDLGQARWIKGVIRSHAGHDLSQAVAVTVVGVLRGLYLAPLSRPRIEKNKVDI